MAKVTWTTRLPLLRAGGVSLRAITPEDGEFLVRMFRLPRVRRHLANSPSSRVAFRGFLEWAERNRIAGRYAGFVVWRGRRRVGMMQVWVTAPGIAELGFALHPSIWGTSVFRLAASQLCRFAFRTMTLHRLEMRIAVANRRAQVAAYKIGGTPEALLREAFVRGAQATDSVLFRLLARELIIHRS